MEYHPDLQTVVLNGHQGARLLEVLPTVSFLDVIDWLQLPSVRFSIVMHLGGIEMDDVFRAQMKTLLRDSVIRFAEDNHILVADGGTDAGIMQIMGEVYQSTHATFPLVGVTAKHAVTYPGGPAPEEGRYPLNPGHTHFVIVEANEFGAESQLLVGMARGAGDAGAAIVINGGPIVRAEVEMHARLGTPVIVLKGTGRYADELAAAEPGSELLEAFDEGSLLKVFDIHTQDPEELYHLLRSVFLR